MCSRERYGANSKQICYYDVNPANIGQRMNIGKEEAISVTALVNFLNSPDFPL